MLSQMLHPSSAAEPQNTTCHSQEHPAGEYGFFLLIYGTGSAGRRGQMALLCQQQQSVWSAVVEEQKDDGAAGGDGFVELSNWWNLR